MAKLIFFMTFASFDSQIGADRDQLMPLLKRSGPLNSQLFDKEPFREGKMEKVIEQAEKEHPQNERQQTGDEPIFARAEFQIQKTRDRYGSIEA